jgi:serine protease Do
MVESEESNPSENLGVSEDPVPETAYVYVHADALPRSPAVPQQPPVPTPKPRRRALQLSRAAAVVVLAFVIMISGAAGFTGGLIAMRMISVPTPTPTEAAATIAPTTTSSPSAIPTLTFADGNASTDGLSVAEIAAIASPGVVEIRTTGTVVVRGRSYAVEGAGSGVILTADGYIVTNHHVVDGAETIKVKLIDGTSYDAVLVDSVATMDIAVLKIEASELPFSTLGASANLVVGDTAVAIGNPLGELGGTVTQGIISSLDRQIDLDGNTMYLLQTDASINPGNSGGGLFNARGQLIGIVVAKSSGSGLEGLGFAIPIDHVKTLIENMISGGKATT